jgi:hypothetical protein
MLSSFTIAVFLVYHCRFLGLLLFGQWAITGSGQGENGRLLSQMRCQQKAKQTCWQPHHAPDLNENSVVVLLLSVDKLCKNDSHTTYQAIRQLLLCKQTYVGPLWETASLMPGKSPSELAI